MTKKSTRTQKLTLTLEHLEIIQAAAGPDIMIDGRPLTAACGG